MVDAGSRAKAFSRYPAPCIHYPASCKISVPCGYSERPLMYVADMVPCLVIIAGRAVLPMCRMYLLYLVGMARFDAPLPFAKPPGGTTLGPANLS